MSHRGCQQSELAYALQASAVRRRNEHAATLDLVRRTQYDQAFIFSYSERSKTFASRHLQVGKVLLSPINAPADCCCGNVSINSHGYFLRPTVSSAVSDADRLST